MCCIIHHKSPTVVYSGTSDNGHSEKQTTSVEQTNCLPPTDSNIQGITSEIGTTSLQWTRGLSPLCPLLRGSTVCAVITSYIDNS